MTVDGLLDADAGADERDRDDRDPDDAIENSVFRIAQVPHTLNAGDQLIYRN